MVGIKNIRFHDCDNSNETNGGEDHMEEGKRNSTVDKSTRAVSSRFAVAIRNARKNKGISLQKLGDATATSASYINRLERFERKNPTVSVLVTLAQELDINVWELLKLAVDEHVDNAPDVADLFLFEHFSIDGVVVNNPELRKVLMDLMLLIVYQLDQDVNYRDIVALVDLIKKFHIEKQAVLEEGA